MPQSVSSKVVQTLKCSIRPSVHEPLTNHGPATWMISISINSFQRTSMCTAMKSHSQARKMVLRCSLSTMNVGVITLFLCFGCRRTVTILQEPGLNWLARNQLEGLKIARLSLTLDKRGVVANARQRSERVHYKKSQERGYFKYVIHYALKFPKRAFPH